MKKKKNLSWILFIIALIYLVFPIDFIPDIIPVVGVLDDMALLIISKFLGNKK